MSKYTGLYTFDVENHRYIPVGQSDGIVDCFNFKHESAEPLIKDEEIRNAVIAWAKANSQRTSVTYHQLDGTHSCINFIDFGGLIIEFNKTIDELTSGKIYNFEELCGEEEE